MARPGPLDVTRDQTSFTESLCIISSSLMCSMATDKLCGCGSTLHAALALRNQATALQFDLVNQCRVAKWISASFGGEDGVQQGPDGVYAHFVSLRTGLPLTISMQASQVLHK